ncbi:hypothetical protein [Pseudomonas citronellolis]|uniref:hypothetical protein n=1 Tax=Pseudomonas citronellolis TaxID=53408 RepID=UPI002FDAFDB9
MRIARIYVDRFGSQTGWYEQTTLDLCDPVTGEPIDACINLENGGGKTSLLAYIFSCFDPRKDRWLQTLQSESHAFRDYFAKDPRPSFLITEWIMPARAANQPDYRLVIGQAVHFTESADRAADTDRRFFAFESGAGLCWESLPVPGVSLAPVKTMQDFLAWAQKFARSHGKGDFIIAHNQYEWMKHLEDQRLIDLELLKMQVTFNSREGGSEEGFLSFSSESELVSRLLTLSLNQEHTQELRSLVAQTMDRLKAKPKHEKKLGQLKSLQEAMRPFAASAEQLITARESLQEVEQEAADLSFGMRLKVNDIDSRLSSTKAAISQFVAQCGVVESQAAEADGQYIALVGHHLQRDRDAAKQRLQGIKESIATGLRRLSCLEAAKATRNIRSISSLLEEQERKKDAVTNELRPLEDEASSLGAMLQHVLRQRIEGLDGNLAEFATTLKQAQAEKKRLSDLRSALESQRADLIGRQGVLNGEVGAAQKMHAELVNQGILLPVDIDVSAAITRVSHAISELNAQLSESDEQRAAMSAELDEIRNRLGDTKSEASNAASAQDLMAAFLSSYEIALESLQHNPLLIDLADGLCDPYSTLLVDELQQLINAIEEEMAQRAIRLDQLNRERESIEQTSLAGRSDDVTAVVEALRKAGIRSARSANTYLAELRPDAAEARALVLSDPARYLGVNVAAHEWESAVRSIDDLGLMLSAPVTLAPASLDLGSCSEGRVVLRPHNDSAYNIEAARQALVRFEDTISSVLADRDVLVERGKVARKVLAEVHDFQGKFAIQLVRNTESELAACRDQHQRALEAITRLECEIQRLERNIDELGRRVAAMHGEIATQNSHVKQLRSYLDTWEISLASYYKELSEIAKQIDRLDAELADQAHGFQLEESRISTTQDSRERLLALRGDLSREHDDVTRFRSDVDAAAEVLRKGFSIDDLRRRYEVVDSELSVAERDRLGLIALQLQKLRAELVEASMRYQNDFGSLDANDVEALLDLDIEAEVASQGRENQSLSVQNEVAVSDASRASTEYEVYWRGRTYVEPTDEMLALAYEEIQGAAERKRQESEEKRSLLKALQEQIATAKRGTEKDLVARKDLDNQIRNLAATFSLEGFTPRQVELGEDVSELIEQLLLSRRTRSKEVEKWQATAEQALKVVLSIARSADFVEVEGAVAEQFLFGDLDTACSDRVRLVEMVDDRIAAVEDNLAEMVPDFERCAIEVYNHATAAASLLKHAMEIKLPTQAPYVGGQTILKMTHNIGMSSDQRKDEIRYYLNRQIEAGVLPRSGAEIITQCLLAFTPRQSFGLHLLKMEQNKDFQYQAVNSMKKSGGQGTVIAVFLYMLVSHLRVDTQAQAKRGGGGPLLLDNPFANVQTRALIDAQRMLAESLKIQLICFTANADANILEGFRRIVRLRKAGVNTKTRRTHIEMATATFEAEGRRV